MRSSELRYSGVRIATHRKRPGGRSCVGGDRTNQFVDIDALVRFQLPPGISESFSPDGTELYVSYCAWAIDIPSAIAYLWPEWLGVAAVLATVVLCVRVRHRVRAAVQVSGLVYCKRCNYCVEGLASARCPECGVVMTLRNRRRGRPAWRQKADAVVVVALPFVVYSIMFVTVPRVSWLDGTRFLPSRLIYDCVFALSPQASVRLRRSMQFIGRYDARTGEYHGDIGSYGEGNWQDPVIVYPNGRAALAADPSGDRVLIDLPDGSSQRVSLGSCVERAWVLRSSPDDGALYVHGMISQPPRTKVWRVFLDGRRPEVCFVTGVNYAHPPGGRPYPWPRRVAPVPVKRSLWLDQRLDANKPNDGTASIWVQGADGEQLAEVPVVPGATPGEFFVSADGRLVVGSPASDSICPPVWDLQFTARRDEIGDEIEGYTHWRGMAFHAGRGLVAVVVDQIGQGTPSAPDAYACMVGELTTRTWIARLTWRDSRRPNIVLFSPDGSRLVMGASVAPAGTTAAGPYQARNMAVYDLSSVLVP